MKASELRIGNYVKCECLDFEEDYIQLDNIHQKGTIKNDNPYSIVELKPIPLTEEWLIKFGFKIYGKDDIPNSPSDWNWGKIGFNISLTYETKKVQYTNINLEYVHQLQNLYFALTGQELIIK